MDGREMVQERCVEQEVAEGAENRDKTIEPRIALMARIGEMGSLRKRKPPPS
jgi:hypothetical protein